MTPPAAPSELFGPSICDVLPSAAAVLGMPGARDPLGLLSDIGPRQQVVVALVDGLGLRLLPRLTARAPFLAGCGLVRELRSTFPSTTPTSLVSLGTGVRPGQHGILGFTVALPGLQRTLTHVTWRTDPDPGVWQPVPTWFERLAAAGVASAVVLPQKFRGSGLTVAAYRGSGFVSADPSSGAAGVGAALAGGSRLVLAYTDVLDAAMHRHGIASEEWLAAAADADRFVAAIADALPDDACLLVTADHGGLDVPQDLRIDLDGDGFDDLAAEIEVVAGEPRVRYLHVRDGAAPDVMAAWHSTLGERVLVLARDEAIDTGWFGSVSPRHRGRVGDVVVICRDDSAVFASRHEPEEITELVGFHGSYSDVETAIPLIAVAR